MTEAEAGASSRATVVVIREAILALASVTTAAIAINADTLRMEVILLIKTRAAIAMDGAREAMREEETHVGIPIATDQAQAATRADRTRADRTLAAVVTDGVWAITRAERILVETTPDGVAVRVTTISLMITLIVWMTYPARG
jgi:hypothetical protein